MPVVPALAVGDEALLEVSALDRREQLFQEEFAEARVAEDVAALLATVADDEASDSGRSLLKHREACEGIRRKSLKIGAGERAEGESAERK